MTFICYVLKLLLTSYAGVELNYITNFKLKTPRNEKKMMIHIIHCLTVVKTLPKQMEH